MLGKEAEINVAKRQTQVIVPDWIVIAILTLDAGLARSGSMKLQQSNQEAIQQVARIALVSRSVAVLGPAT